MSGLETALSIALGVALAAAVGFRIFLPLLVTSIAGYTGHLQLSDSFAWLGTVPAVTMLGAATAAELVAYYIPAVDNVLDAIAAPVALIAGTLVSAAVMTDLPPLIKWSTAIIAGGGAAGITQGVTTFLRAKSTLFTGGLGNPVLATGEWIGAILISLLALVAPVIALAAVIGLSVWAVQKARRGLRRAAP